MGERPRREVRAGSVGDRATALFARPRDELRATERLLGVGRERGFDADDPRVRVQRPDRSGHPADESAPADRHEQRAEVVHRLRDLEPGRALARDHVVVVVRVDERDAVCFPVRARGLLVGHGSERVDRDHLRAVGADPFELHGRCIGRHEHGGRDPEQARSASHALGVVAARRGHHAARADREVKACDGVVRAADLERADRLERFGLEQDRPAVGCRERDERRGERHAAEALRCRANVVDGDWAVHGAHAPRSLRNSGVDASTCSQMGWYENSLFGPIADDIARVAPPGAAVLEVGCGSGALSIRLAAHHGLAVTAVDVDPDEIRRAREKAARTGSAGRATPEFLVADVARMPFDDASFDLVVSTFSMHHWDDKAGRTRGGLAGASAGVAGADLGPASRVLPVPPADARSARWARCVAARGARRAGSGRGRSA